MGKSISGENRKLLPTNQCCQSVYRRNTGTNIISRIFPTYRIERKSVNISFIYRIYRAKTVNRLSDTIESSSQHIRRYCYLHWTPGQSCVRILKRHIFCSFEYLNDCLILIQFNDTAHFLCIAFYNKLYDFIIESSLYPFQHNKRSIYIAQSKIFYCHLWSPLMRSFP